MLIYTHAVYIQSILAYSITQICSWAQEQTVMWAAVGIPQFMEDATASTSSSPERAKESLQLITGFWLGTFSAQRET